MGDTLKSYFDFSQLSMAAYATLTPGAPNTTALTAAGFSNPLAEQFASTYTVKSVSGGDFSGFGFSATLFERTVVINNVSTVEKILSIRGTDDLADSLIDAVNIGILGSENLNPQYGELKRYVDFLFSSILQPNDKLIVTGHSLGGFLAQGLAADSAYASRIDKVYTYNAPGFGGPFTGLLNALGISNPLVGSLPVGNVTNLVASNGLSPIAGLGQHIGQTQSLFVETGDPLHNHSIVTLTDSLALYNLLGTIDPQADISRLTGMLNAVGTSGGSSLEQTLYALRSLFQTPPNSLTLNTPLETGERDAYYLNIETLNVFLATVPTGTLTVESLVNQPAGTVAALAEQSPNELDPRAYRYALTQLNPFVIHGADYDRHNTTGELELVNPSAGTGALTHDYLFDRALFLFNKIAANLTDSTTIGGSTHFQDLATGYELSPGIVIPLSARDHIIFGSDLAETIVGGSHGDQLYGGGSVDVLIGNAGRDYLEGNGGSDRLEGGAGADTMVGGAGNDTYLVDDLGDQVIEVGDNGNDTVESSVSFSLIGTTVETLTLTGGSDINGTGNELDNLITGNGGINRLDGKGGTDHLIGGIGNDILAGGTGNNDLLEGGIGFDTYIYNAGDGADRIEDSDAKGQIIFQGHRLLGGIHDPNDPLNTYKSLDGLTTYVLSGTDLIVNGVLTVNANF